jgi:hypothetical protein
LYRWDTGYYHPGSDTIAPALIVKPAAAAIAKIKEVLAFS